MKLTLAGERKRNIRLLKRIEKLQAVQRTAAGALLDAEQVRLMADTVEESGLIETAQALRLFAMLLEKP